MAQLIEFSNLSLDRKAISLALEEYKKFREADVYDEGYKWEVLGEINEELNSRSISSENVADIIQYLQKKNSDGAPFAAWNELSPLEKFAEESPSEAAEKLKNLFEGEASLDDRIGELREAVDSYSKAEYKLNLPGVAYLLAAYDADNFAPYKGEAFRAFLKWFATDYDMPGNVEEKALLYFELCEKLKQITGEDDILLSQDFIYSITQYEDLRRNFPLVYASSLAGRLESFESDIDSFLDAIGDLPEDYLENKVNQYREDSENIREIRRMVSEELIDGSLSEEEFEGIIDEANQGSETNIMQAWSSFSVLAQLYLDFFGNINRIISLISENLKEEINPDVFDTNVVDFTGARNSITTDPWIALHPNSLSHEESPMLVLHIYSDKLRYGLDIGDDFKPRNEDLKQFEEIRNKEDYSFVELVDELKDLESTLWELKKPQFWIEKSYITSREDRKKGPRRAGKCLWSPEEKKNNDNSKYYENLKLVEPSDIILHLDQEERKFIGASKAKAPFEKDTVLENTEWDNVGVQEMGYDRGERPCYLVELKDFVELDQPLDVNDVFCDGNKEILNEIYEDSSGLVFNKNFNLNQGAYLTKAPEDLVSLISEVYEEEKGSQMPYVSKIVSINGRSSDPPSDIEVDQKLSAELDLDFDNLYFPEDKAESIKSQIRASLTSGKHIIFTGPPGTGKTELAEKVAREMENSDDNVTGHQLTTATSDWSTFDTVGGYRPEDDGSLEFKPGHILRRFKDDEKDLKNEPLVIDEINRADIDKAFGQLFTVLSGQKVQLPFTKGEAEKEVEVVPGEKFENPVQDHEFVIPESWRILATMNTYDKTSLYEMSYAFMRRFSFIRIEAPDLEDDYTELMKGYLDAWNLENLYSEEENEIDLDELVEDVAGIWKRVNNAVKGREIGPAIAKDMIEFSDANDRSRKDANTAAITNFILPQLEGVPDRKKIVKSLFDEDLDVDENRLKSTAGSMLQVEFDGEN